MLIKKVTPLQKIKIVGLIASNSPQIAHRLEQTVIGSKYHTKGGAGFAAEDANAFADRWCGKIVENIGANNAKNGADRITDGVHIQTKYFSSAQRTLNAAFDSVSGNFRYSGQRLEVPKDQYKECVRLMQEKIHQGKVVGISDPIHAEQLIQRGSVTYTQARNIARPGNWDSLKFDAETQSITALSSFGISFIVDFGMSLYRKEDVRKAAQEAAIIGLRSGGIAYLTSITAAQVLRTRGAAVGTVLLRPIVRTVASTGGGRTAVQSLATASLGKSLAGGAAINHVSKLLRSNVVTSVITTFVVMTPDTYRAAVAKSISWRQFSKNLTTCVAGVAGGTGGWMAGAALGAMAGSAVPVFGTAIGGIVGGLIGSLGGGLGASILSKKGVDYLLEDDANHMIKIVQKLLGKLAYEYMLSEDELEIFIGKAKLLLTPSWLRRMYSHGRDKERPVLRQRFARIELEAICQAIVECRPKLHMPSDTAIQKVVNEFVEEIVTSETYIETIDVVS